MSGDASGAAQDAVGVTPGRVLLTVRIRDKDGRVKADGVQLEGKIEPARLLFDDYVEAPADVSHALDRRP